MNKNKWKVLNEPFVLWFLSSVLIGFISWQYTEVQKNSAEKKVQARVLKKARLELRLLLQDIELGASLKDKTTASHLTGTVTLMQYNALNESNQFYVATLQNIMLEIDSRTDSRGLELYQRRIFEHLKVISLSIHRVITFSTKPSDLVWNRLSDAEKENLGSLVLLTKEINEYYEVLGTSS
ncbi:hypothetical protein NO989_21400 [Alteromonas sp. DY56-G5]|uniref:hypothetical protein n=1 Tax=Alteromonas sp. DY56-G5 TaxID=2967128 RepID=UPI00352A5A83